LLQFLKLILELEDQAVSTNKKVKPQLFFQTENMHISFILVVNE